MLVQFLAAASLSQNLSFWAPCPKGASLIYRNDAEGCGYADESKSEVILLSSKGDVQKRIPIPEGQRALYYDKDQGLVTCQAKIFSHVDGSNPPTSFRLFFRFFAQNDKIFSVADDITLVGRPSLPGCMFPNYGPYDAIGVSRDWSKVVLFARPYDHTLIRTASLAEGSWAFSANPPSPFVKRVGQCGITPQRNTLVILSKDYVAYVGSFLSANPNEYETWKESLPDYSKLSMGKGNRESYLFVTSLFDGNTVGIAIVSGSSNGPELATSQKEQTMTESADGKFVYVYQDGGILRFESKALLDRGR